MGMGGGTPTATTMPTLDYGTPESPAYYSGQVSTTPAGNQTYVNPYNMWSYGNVGGRNIYSSNIAPASYVASQLR